MYLFIELVTEMYNVLNLDSITILLLFVRRINNLKLV